MPTERTDVQHPLWRKKVDSSLFEHLGTTIPNWVCRTWEIPNLFGNVSSKKSPSSRVSILFSGKEYPGSVTVARMGRTSPAFRLWYTEELLYELKQTFLMSYMRHLEGQLRKRPSERKKLRHAVEEEIPFWEFLDIEFDKSTHQFRFVAHYKQKPLFPELFLLMQGTPTLQRIEDRISKAAKDRIYKQPWRHRDMLEKLPEQENVIYYLLDSKSEEFYVGEAKKLKQRLLGPHPTIPRWDHFRFDALPDELGKQRVALERMLIRAFASIMPSEKSVSVKQLSKFKLTNLKIDS